MKCNKYLINGIDLAVYESGTEGTPLVLLHPGGIFASYVWEEMIGHLCQSHRVFAIDIHGHGHSDYPKDEYNFDTMARDLLEVFNIIKLQKVHIIGNSLGAEVGLVFASKYPEKVLSLIQIDGGIINYLGLDGEMEGTMEEIVTARLHRPVIDFATRDEFLTFANENFSAFAPIIEKIPLRKLANGKVTFQQDNYMAAKLLASGCQLDMLTLYKSISCPVLFLPAEKEAKLQGKLDAIKQFSSFLPFSKTVIIPDTTHIMMIHHGIEICRELELFFQDIRLLFQYKMV